jgi:hypothetical protein
MTTPPPPPEAPRTRSLPWIGAAVVLLLVVGFATRRRSLERSPQGSPSRTAPTSRPPPPGRAPTAPPPPPDAPAGASPAPPPPAPARWRPGHGELFPEERPIIAPLREGASLGPGQVFELSHHFEARVMVGVRVAGRELWLQVSRADGAAVPLLAREGPFAVTALPSEVAEAERGAVVAALAQVLRRNVAVPVPSVMQPIRGASAPDAGPRPPDAGR